MSTTAAPISTDAARASAAGSGRRAVLFVYAAIVAAMLVGIAVGVLAPSVAPGDGVRRTLHGSLEDVVSILATNLRVLAVPLLLAAGGWARGRTQVPGDAIVAILVIGNALVVGVAIGAHRAAILPFLPHLPIEWAALSVATAAWIRHRGRRASWRSLGAYVLATVALATCAAMIEGLAVPHA